MTSPEETPWEVQHHVGTDDRAWWKKGFTKSAVGIHFAWFQRAAVVGDFAPGLTPRSEYVVDSDGRAADLTTAPVCETCGAVPKTDHLILVERATGRNNWLNPFRDGRPWPPTTSDDTCVWCNNMPVTGALFCGSCDAHLRRTHA